MSRFPGPVTREEEPRLHRQHEVIRELMLRYKMSFHEDGWWSLRELESATGFPQSSISAQLRHLRKESFGSYRVEKRRRTDGGTWEYRVLPKTPPIQVTICFPRKGISDE